MKVTSKGTRWTKRQQIPNLQVKESADQFDKGARELYKLLMRPGTGVLLPFLNLSIMAVELYLKSLSSSSVYVPTAWDPEMSTVHAQPDAPTHNLERVFNTIPSDVQKKLEDAFKTWPNGRRQAVRGPALCDWVPVIDADRDRSDVAS